MYDERIQKEQIRLFVHNLPNLVITSLVGTVILIILIWGRVSLLALLSWVFLSLLINVVTFHTIRRFKKIENKSFNLKKWYRLTIALSLARSTIWGLSGVFLYVENDFAYQVLVLTFCVAGSIQGGFVAASYKPAAFIYILPTLFPVAIRNLVEGDLLHYSIAIMLVIYAFSLMSLSRKMHLSLMNALVLQFEKSELAAQLDLQKQTAEQANLAKSRFLAAASHDLRQPLQAQGMFLAELDKRIRDKDDRLVLKKIQQSFDTLSGQFDSLLDISKLDAGVISPTYSHVHIQSLLDDVKLYYSMRAKEKGLIFKVRDCNKIIFSDPDLLARILNNLVSNAIRYTNKGTVLVGCRPRGDKLRIEIRDSGPGIAKYQQEHIFHEFYQKAVAGVHGEKGMGLGLSIASRLARLLGLKIKIFSSPGMGSRFWIDVPVGDPDKMISGHFPESQNIKDNVSDSSVLIIDDDEMVLESMAGALRQWGCKVFLAKSGNEALALLKNPDIQIDAIISDYRLSENEKGTDAISAVHKAIGREIPAMLITGDTAPERLKEATNCGYHLLHKPVAPAKLRSLLSFLLPG